MVTDASIMFAGTLQRTEPCAGGGFQACHDGVFSVAEVFKGKLGDTVTLRYERQNGVNCGAVFRLGAAQLVVANGSAKNGYFASGCGQPMADLTSYSNTYLLAARRYRVALDAIDSALAKDPASVRFLYKRAAFLTEWKAVEEGLEAVDQLLAKDPNQPAALKLKADLLTMTGQDQAASQIRDALSAAAPAVDQRKRQEVDALVRAGRWKEVPQDWLDFAGLDANYVAWSWINRPLDGANFSKAQLVGARFERTRLKGAIFTNANLENSNFESVDLTDASLMRANVTAQFKWTKLVGADLSGATGRPDFDRADLTGALLLSVEFERVNFQQTKMAGAVLAGAQAPGSHFTLADLSGADLSYAALDGGMFRGAVLRGANLTGASFRGYDGQPADFTNADLEGAILDGATFTSAVYNCETKWPAGFDPGTHGLVNYYGDNDCGTPDFSWLREPFLRDRHGLEPVDTASGMVSFAERQLQGVSFRGAWLPTSDFVKANLAGADLSHVKAELDVRGADLTNADLSFADLTRWKVDPSTKLDGVKLRGARILIKTGGTSGIEHPDLAKMDFRGAILVGYPATLPEGIDPVAMGIVLTGTQHMIPRFEGYNLRNADLRGFDLSRAWFQGIDLSGADLRGAILNDVDFRGATLTGTKLLGACYGIHTRWPEGFDTAAAGVVYCGEYRNGARRELPPPDMPVPNLAGEDLSEREFQEAFLLNANLDRAVLKHTRFYISYMKGASLRGADLTGASLISVFLEGADLTGASLRNADLRGARLSDANLTKADLTGAVYNLATVWPVGFDPVAAEAKIVTE
jgi:uncharacterized protein YjbI with pentapeptide repeats